MIELARVLDLPERHEQEQEQITHAVLHWLRRHSDWLLIYDNIDDLSLAEPFLPKAMAGHLLLTTRAHALGGLAQWVDVQQMQPDVGTLLLLRRASLLPLEATLDKALRDQHQCAQTISQELDGLPLALDQAGAYIKEVPCPLLEYLTRYRMRRRDLLQARGSSSVDYPASVVTTWSLSFEKIRVANPAAAELLNFCAFLAPDAIPDDLLKSGASHLGALLAPVVADAVHFDRACTEVLRFSLFQRAAEEYGSTQTVHRLVQAILRDTIAAERQRQWMQRAVYVIETVYPQNTDFANWSVQERLLPHALRCAQWIEQEHFNMPEASLLLNGTGSYLHVRARYKEAEPLYVRALEIRERQLGDEHPDTAGNLNNLAGLYRAQGKYAEAEPLHLRALEIKEQQLKAEHPNTATSLNNLALLYRARGSTQRLSPCMCGR